MGAADVDIFDDDDAADWVYELEETDDLSLVVESLTTVIGAEDEEYIERDVCARALAAAAVLAGLLQGTSRGLPDEVKTWLRAHRHLDGSVYREMAVRAVELCRDDPNSELRDLWEETVYFAAWRSVLDKLMTRLR